MSNISRPVHGGADNQLASCWQEAVDVNNDWRTPYLSRAGFQGFPELKQAEPGPILCFSAFERDSTGGTAEVWLISFLCRQVAFGFRALRSAVHLTAAAVSRSWKDISVSEAPGQATDARRFPCAGGCFFWGWF